MGVHGCNASDMNNSFPREDMCGALLFWLSTALEFQHFPICVFPHMNICTFCVEAISTSFCYPCRSPSSSGHDFMKTITNHWKNNILVMTSVITRILIKPVENEHFAARASGQTGSCPASSPSRCPGHGPQPATKVRNARFRRNAPVVPRGGGSACPGTLQIN